LGLEGLAVERVELTGLGVKIVQLSPMIPTPPGVRVVGAVELGQGLGFDPARGPSLRR
jgi:hypothetical protein